MTNQNLSTEWAFDIFGKKTVTATSNPANSEENVVFNNEILQGHSQPNVHQKTMISSPSPPNKFSTKICSARLIIYSEKIQGESYELSKNIMLLGRASSNDIIIPDPCISAKHCEFELREDGVWVHDLKSANGTFVNGQVVSERLLRSGDVIRCGTSIIKFEIAIKRPRLAAGTDFDLMNAQRSSQTENFQSKRNISKVNPAEGPISFEKISVSDKNTKTIKVQENRKPVLLISLILICLTLFIIWLVPNLANWLSR